MDNCLYMNLQYKRLTYKERKAKYEVQKFVQNKEDRLKSLVFWLYDSFRTNEPCFICYDFLKLEIYNYGILKNPSNIGMFDEVHQKTYFFRNEEEALQALNEIQVDLVDAIINEKDFTIDNKMAKMKLKIKDIEHDFK